MQRNLRFQAALAKSMSVRTDVHAGSVRPGRAPCPTAGGVALRKPELAALFYKVNQGTDLRRIFDLRYLLSEKNMLIDCLAHC
jgi:hypothetical protein